MSQLFDELSTWATTLTWSDVPEAAQRRAHQALVDTIATMAGGSRTPAAAVASTYTKRWIGSGSAPAIGIGSAVRAPQAAFVNAISASALDFDDGHYHGGAIHPGSVIVTAVISSSSPETTVQSALLAQVVGYEVGLRAAKLLFPKVSTDRYHATGCAGAIGAAAAVAKLFNLDADGFRRAVHIAYCHAPLASFGTPMVKEAIGWGALTGVTAAELSADGMMTTTRSHLPAPARPRPATPFHTPEAEQDPFVNSFGTTFETANTYFKPFASCRYTHAAAGGFLELIGENNLRAADIRQIQVATHSRAAFLTDQTPATIDSAQYSFPFVLGALAHWGELGGREMSESQLDDADVLDLASRVHVTSDASLDVHYPSHYASRVEIQTGTSTYSGTFIEAPGDLGSRFSEADLTAKALRLIGDHTGVGVAEKLLADLNEAHAKLQESLAPLW